MLETLELFEDTGITELEYIDELIAEVGILETELDTGVAETKDTIILESDDATELEEVILEELTATEEVGTTLDKLELLEDTGITELEADADEELVMLDEVTGVEDDTEAIIELVAVELGALEITELAEAGILLIKLETNELEAMGDELAELCTSVAELILEILELLIEESELSKLLKLVREEENTEFELLEVETNELLFIELLEAGNEFELEDSKEELEILDEFELAMLELFTEELLIEDELLSGVALNTTFKGLSHGIVKSKLIAKKLYCTRQVKPSPEVNVCADIFGVKIIDKEAKLSENTIAEIVM